MTVIWAALGVGAIYGIIALGYIITHTTAGVLNLAFANVVMLGGFVGYWATTVLHLPIVVVVLLAGGLGAAICAIEELVAIRPLRRNPGSHMELVTTIGVATVITGILVLVWSTDPITVEFGGTGGVVTIFGGRVRIAELVLLGVAVVACMAFFLWSRWSRLGLASVAQTEDREAAILRGLDVGRLSLVGFVGAGLLAGAVGPVVATVTTASAFASLTLAVKGFVAMIVGGVGNPAGALLGGLVIGLSEAVMTYYLGASYANVAVFVIFLVVVLARPSGILGRRMVRTV